MCTRQVNPHPDRGPSTVRPIDAIVNTYNHNAEDLHSVARAARPAKATHLGAAANDSFMDDPGPV